MKKSHLKQVIKEEIRLFLKEPVNEGLTVTFEFPDERKARQFDLDIENSAIGVGDQIGNKVTVTDVDTKWRSTVKKYMKKNRGKVVKESVNESGYVDLQRKYGDEKPRPRKYDKEDIYYAIRGQLKRGTISRYDDDLRDKINSYASKFEIPITDGDVDWVLSMLDESIKESIKYTFNRGNSSISEMPGFKEEVIQIIKSKVPYADDGIIEKFIKSAERYYAFKEKKHVGLGL